MWSSEINLGDDNIFVETFFSNTKVCPICVDFDIVYVDDTACTNAFMLPVVVVLGATALDRFTFSHGAS